MKTQVSVWRSRFAMILISLGILSHGNTGLANPLLNPFQNRTGSHRGLFLEPVAGFFTTSENFDEFSSRVPIQNSTTNTRLSLDVNGSYGLSDDFFIFGRLSLLSASVSIQNQSAASGLGLSDQLAGAAYRVLNTASGISLNLQAEFTIPAYNNTDAKNSGKAYLGDESVDITGGAFVEFPLGSKREFYLEGGAGYTYRSKGFSACVPYSLKIKRDPIQKGWVLEAGAIGQMSLNTDIATDSAPAQNVLNQDRLAGSGGSNLINALNPAWLMLAGKIGFKNRHGQVFYAGTSAPIAGTNAPSGISFILGASLDFGAKASPETPEAESKPASRNRSYTPPGKAPPPLSKNRAFTTYDLDAKILNFNDQLYLVRINKGSTDGVEQGQYFDIFSESAPVARARVTQVKDDEAILSVLEYFQERWIETDFSARRLVR